MANIASIRIAGEFGNLVITAHNRNRLTDDEWENNYLRHIRKMKEIGAIDNCANLVFAEGEGPNSKQRRIGNEIFGSEKEYKLRVSVVTDSLLVRGAVTAFRWFNPLIDAFKPSEYARALEHLRLRPGDASTVAVALRELGAQIADASVLNQVLELHAADHPARP